MANYAWALDELRAGRKVRRREWIDPTLHIYSAGRVEPLRGYLRFSSTGATVPSFWGDIDADDWELYHDRPVLDGSYGAAMQAVADGHTVQRSGRPNQTVTLNHSGVICYSYTFDASQTRYNFVTGIEDLRATDWAYA